MRILTSFFASIFFVTNVSYSQTGVIKGGVTNSLDSTDLSDIRITVYIGTRIIESFILDSSGTFMIDSLIPGKYDVYAGKLGFDSDVQTGIVVSAYKYTILDHFILINESVKIKRRRR